LRKCLGTCSAEATYFMHEIWGGGKGSNYPDGTIRNITQIFQNKILNPNLDPGLLLNIYFTPHITHHDQYSKTSRIRANWKRTLVTNSESHNYNSDTENIFRKITKWTSSVFSGNTTLFGDLDYNIVK
jgi:hypothetical protein